MITLKLCLCVATGVAGLLAPQEAVNSSATTMLAKTQHAPAVAAQSAAEPRVDMALLAAAFRN